MNAVPTDYLLPGGGASISALPKVSLHDHLDGGLRPQTIIELGRRRSASSCRRRMPRALGDWFAEKCRLRLARRVPEDLRRHHRASCRPRRACAASPASSCEDLAADGVDLRRDPLGARAAPHARPHPRRGRRGRAGGHRRRGRRRRGAAAAASGSASSSAPCATSTAALEIAELAVRHRDHGVVGFDIAGAGGRLPGRQPARRLRLPRASTSFPATVHAGEADGLDSIRGALFDGRALRLGHGVRIAEDITIEREDDENSYVTLGPVAQWVKDREIALETQPAARTCRPAPSPPGATSSSTTRSTCSTSSASGSPSTPTTG